MRRERERNTESPRSTRNMHRLILLCLFCFLCSSPLFSADLLRDFVSTYCVTCHNDRLKTGNLTLEKADTENVFNSAETWEKVAVKLRSRSMPPVGNKRADNATYETVATWLETELDRAVSAHPNP